MGHRKNNHWLHKERVFIMVKTLSGLFAVENTSVVDMRKLQITIISYPTGPASPNHASLKTRKYTSHV
jgi:hypothetical protein